MSNNKPLRRGVDGICTRSACECEREGLGDQCIWLKPAVAEFECLGEPSLCENPRGCACVPDSKTPNTELVDKTSETLRRQVDKMPETPSRRRAIENDTEALLRLCADDPMWAEHAEVSKSLLVRAADELAALRKTAKQPQKLPVVLTRDEVARLWLQIPQANIRGLVLRLLYGAGLRLTEGLRLRIAHNETFDARILRIALMRHEDAPLADRWKEGPAACTATMSTPLCRIPPTAKMLAAGRKNFKTPNLGEAYRHFTGRDLVDAHTADADVQACRAVYFAIKAGQHKAAA